MSKTSIGKLLLCLFFFFGFAKGRFTAVSCFYTNCVQQDSTGRWCYLPAPGWDQGTGVCPGPYMKNSDLTSVIGVHIKQGLSIAYYNAIDNVRLGGANYTFPPGAGPAHLCVSGKAGDGSYQTLCLVTSLDNDIWPESSMCIVNSTQEFVSDGCYVPESGVVLTDDPSTSTLALPSSASTSSVSTTASLHVITPTLTTLLDPTLTTIITHGATQTVIVAPLNGTSGSSNSSKSVILPIILVLFAVILVALGVFVWWYKKRARERKPLPPPFDPDEPPPSWDPKDGRATSSEGTTTFMN